MKENLSDKMKSEAVSLGLCAQWTADWEDNSSKDEMIEKFISGIDFCIARNWPSCEIMKKYFGDRMHDHGVYVDENVNLYSPKTLVLNGECVADITYGETSSGEIHVRHNCTLNLKVDFLSRVFVNVYDNAKVNIKCDYSSKVFVYQYGGKIGEIKGNNIIIRDRKNFKFK